MSKFLKTFQNTAKAVLIGMMMTGPAIAQDAKTRLETTIQKIEQSFDARLGIAIYDIGSDWSFYYQENEPSLMNSTFKVFLCGAILKQVDEGSVSLSENINISQSDILHYAPVTKSYVGSSMTIAELCEATLDKSDNTAANLLIDRLNGPATVTKFLRGLGDKVTRLDRREPEMNVPGPTGKEDTSTPMAMASTLQTLLLGDGLSETSRMQLRKWMSNGGVTGAFLRATAPSTWKFADKSGGGLDTRSIIAMVSPSQGTTYFVSVYLSDADVDFKTRSAVLAELSAAVVDLLEER